MRLPRSGRETRPIAAPERPDYWRTHVALRKLGSGRFGRVYLVQDVETQETRALKQFRECSEHVQQEVAVLRALQASGRARALGLCELHAVAWVPSRKRRRSARLSAELECAAGVDLWTLLRRGGGELPARDLLDVATGCAAALRRLHAAGLLHRDLKLENVMWDPAQRRVRLIDLGYVCRWRACPEQPALAALPLASAAELGGTAAYAPPETLAEPSRASDVWALGLLLLELVLGGALADEADAAEASHVVQEGRLAELLADAAVSARRVAWLPLLQRALEPEPRQRASAADLEAALRDPLFRQLVAKR